MMIIITILATVVAAFVAARIGVIVRPRKKHERPAFLTDKYEIRPGMQYRNMTEDEKSFYDYLDAESSTTNFAIRHAMTHCTTCDSAITLMSKVARVILACAAAAVFGFTVMEQIGDSAVDAFTNGRQQNYGLAVIFFCFLLAFFTICFGAIWYEAEKQMEIRRAYIIFKEFVYSENNAVAPVVQRGYRKTEAAEAVRRQQA
jgi:hypothetical protein